MEKKFIFYFNGMIVKASISEYNTNIEDSYRFKNISSMRDILRVIRAESLNDSTERAISKRSLFSMVNEWRVHNLLYALGIKRDRVKSVDLNIGQPWYIKAVYTLLSPFYLHFV
jgi:hypothetical protein